MDTGAITMAAAAADPARESAVQRLSSRFAESSVEGGVGVQVLRMGGGGTVVRVPLTAGGPWFVSLAVAADNGIGMAVHTVPAAPVGGPTIDLRLDHVAEPAPGARELVVEGEALGAPTEHDETGVGRVVVRDDTGRTVAHGIGTMLITRLDGRGFEDQWADTVPGPRLDPAALLRTLETAPVRDGVLHFPLDPALGNVRGDVHGGVVLVIGRIAARRITGVSGRMLDTSVEYLRPLPTAGLLTCRNVPERLGRRYRTDRTELVLPNGKIGAIVRSATALG